MNTKLIIAAAALVAFTIPSMAATDYFVAKNTTTKKCEITEAKPDGKALMMIGKAAFKAKADAEIALKAAADCK